MQPGENRRTAEQAVSESYILQITSALLRNLQEAAMEIMSN